MLPLKNYNIKRDDEYYKRCIDCNIYAKLSRDRNLCEHDRRRALCKECKGASICEHDRIKSACRDCLGSSFCEHDRRRYNCVECKGGSICEHLRQRSQCKECEGGSICEHKSLKYYCKYCNLTNYVRNNINRRMYHAIGHADLEYLGCTIEEFIAHIEGEFVDGMTWENHGEWHIDHIKPLGAKGLTEEEIIERLEFTNTQPLWAFDNRTKGNKDI